MTGCFNCKICDKTIKIKSEKEYLDSQYYQALTKSTISSYYITNTKFS